MIRYCEYANILDALMWLMRYCGLCANEFDALFVNDNTTDYKVNYYFDKRYLETERNYPV